MRRNLKLNWRVLCAALVAAWLGSELPSYAQFGPGGGGGGGFGGFGGFGGGGGGANRQSRGTTRQYPNNGTVGDAIISMDPETHQLVVIADEDTKKYIQQVIASLDKPKPQVLIKVVFVEVTHNNSSDIGIEGGFTQTNNSTVAALANAFGLGGTAAPTGSNAPPVNVFGQPVTAFTPLPPGAGVYQVFATDYQVTLRAIAQSGKAKLLSRPSVVARNNQPATILVGQTVPLITSVRYDSLGNAINGITYTDIGIILRVTPFITADGLVQMILSPETSAISPTDKVQIQAGTFAPVIDKRSADTVVVTPDGQTVIIGGLMANQKTESESKIPLVGDIPWVGNLFKHKTKSEVKTELLIFLTPHIIHSPGDMASLTEHEDGKSEGMKTLTEKELDKFLEGLPPIPKDKDSGKSGHKGKSGADTGNEF
jgi:general secretion pathway protein D